MTAFYTLLPKCLPYESDAAVDVLHCDDVGFWVESEIVECLMLPEELREYRAEMKYEAACAAEWGCQFAYCGPDPEIVKFSTPEDAMEHAALQYQLAFIDFEIDAYHAPSECRALASADIVQRLHELEARHV